MQQRISSTRVLLSLCAFALCTALGSAARADATRIAVLALDPGDADESLASDVAGAARDVVRDADGYALNEAHGSLDQLSMVNDCDPGAPACMRKLAKGLSVDGLIYGSLATKQGKSVLVELKYFDARPSAAAAPKRATYVFAKPQVEAQELSEAARGLIGDLLGIANPSAAPAPAVAPAAAPEATSAQSEAPAGPVVEPEYSEAPPSAGVSTRKIAGFSLLGVAVASVGLSALSFVQLDRASSNDTFHDYRVAVGAQNPKADACDEADAKRMYGLSPKRFSEVRGTCSSGNTYELLQYVFIGAAVLTGGASAYLLLGDSSSSGSERASAQKKHRLAFRPMVNLSGAGVSARLQF